MEAEYFEAALAPRIFVNYFLWFLQKNQSLEKLAQSKTEQFFKTSILEQQDLKKSPFALANLAKLVFWSILASQIFF